MKLRATAAAAILVLASLPLAAQKEPKRPKLPEQADTNDAQTYYNFAIQRLKDDPGKAADALYWATRLEPTRADAFYARRVALLMVDKTKLSRYWSGDRRTIESKEIRQIDSLFYHALTMNPFVSQILEREMWEAIANEIAQRFERNGGGTAVEARYYIDQATSTWGPAFRAWLAYGEGRYADALAGYARAIKENNRNGGLHIDRARIFQNINQPDSALASLTAAIEDMRKRDKKDLIYVYQSKALTEHMIAAVHQRLGNDAAAREAYGRAIQEDLSYYPAHVQLAFMALDAKDTATALTEFDLAIQLRPDDANARYQYGYTLIASGKAADAEPQLKKAIELNPVFAAPKYLYATLLAAASFTEDAVDMYKQFLATASKNDPRRADAEARLAKLTKPDHEELR